MMTQKTAPTPCGKAHEAISILAVVAVGKSAEIERILSHTRWQLHLVHSIREAIQVLQSLPISVVLCADRLPDGRWLDILSGTAKLFPRSQTIVFSASADMALLKEVLDSGAYDLLATPLRPRDVYALVPMAWRQSNSSRNTFSHPQRN